MASCLQQRVASLPFAGVRAGLYAVLQRWLLKLGLLLPVAGSGQDQASPGEAGEMFLPLS